MRALDVLPTTKYSCCCSNDYMGSSLGSRGLESIGKLLLCLNCICCYAQGFIAAQESVSRGGWSQSVEGGGVCHRICGEGK